MNDKPERRRWHQGGLRHEGGSRYRIEFHHDGKRYSKVFSAESMDEARGVVPEIGISLLPESAHEDMLLSFGLTERDQYVFFARRLRPPSIRIGTSWNPRRYLQGFPEHLFLGSVSGGHEVKRFVHALFDESRLDGDYFKPTPELEWLISRVRQLSEGAR